MIKRLRRASAYQIPSGSAVSWHFVLVVSWSLLLGGCASMRVEYLTDQTYPPRDGRASVQVVGAEPSRPYIELAVITASSANLGEPRLRQKILDRARSLGADAVILGDVETVATLLPSPYYEPGLFGPAGAAFGLYGFGWSIPYASNPYLLTQGAVDQPRFDKYLSGVAIRYQAKADTETFP